MDLQSYNNDYTGCPNVTAMTDFTTTEPVTSRESDAVVTTTIKPVTTSGNEGTCVRIQNKKEAPAY